MNAGDPTAARPSFGGVRADGGEATWRFAAAGVVPEAVVRPAAASEVVEIVRSARECGKGLVAAGKGVRLGIGNPPRRYDIAVSTERLTAVEAHVPEDMTITVQSGLTLASLNEVLAGSGQWLPLDPAAAEETTVGGLIAADACGPLRQSHGKVRDFLLGVELVNGHGEIVRAGGRVVKNVAGYDVGKLICGSFGTLGIVLSATFKVRPRPIAQRMLVWLGATIEEAIGRAALVARDGVVPCYLEALNEGACEAIGLECAAALVVGLEGSPAEVESQEAEVIALGGGAPRPWPQDKAIGALQAVRNFSLPINEEAVVARVATRPSLLAETVARIESEARSRGVLLEIAAHAGVGVARCQILGRGDTVRVALFAEWLRLAVRDRAGWVIYEAVPAELRGKVDAWGFNQPTLALMRGVKQVFDPHGIFSPGRFVGEI